MGQRDRFDIPINGFVSNEVIQWLFTDQAQDYGDFLGNLGHREITFYVQRFRKDHFDTEKYPFARQLFISGVSSSSINSMDMSDEDFGILGISKMKAD